MQMVRPVNGYILTEATRPGDRAKRKPPGGRPPGALCSDFGITVFSWADSP